jgi:hypothetical protein
MSERQTVYAVQTWHDDNVLTLLSVHSTRESAQAAVPQYIADYRLGGSEKDYVINSWPLDWTIYEEDK